MKFKKLFDNLITEEISVLFKCGVYRFEILGDEASIPHLHFSINNNANNSGCLALLYKGYANHGKHKLILDKKVLLVAETWLSVTENWNFACNCWNGDSSNKIKITTNSNPYYIEANNKNDRLKRYLQNRNLDFKIIKKII